MHAIDNLKAGLVSIKNHKMRSFLTMLGILIGVSALITMFSAVSGIQAYIRNSMERMGWNYSVNVMPGAPEQTGSTRRRRHHGFIFWQMREDKPLTIDDYIYLKHNVRHKQAYGFIEVYRYFFNGIKYNYISVKGINSSFFETQKFELASGRFFNTYEELKGGKVCILGANFKDLYFKDKDPLGQTITLGDQHYNIVGILKNEVPSTGNFDFGYWSRFWTQKSVFVPLATGSQLEHSDGAIDYIYMQAFDEGQYYSMKSRINQALLARHSMQHDFNFEDVGADMLQTNAEIDGMINKWKITLSAIATISLLVGGIGLFSTLLISISEKMLEIGVRKSLGATEGDIFTYFLTEALMLAILGAVLGAGLSLASIAIMGKMAGISFPVSLPGLGLGFTFALAIGFISGFFPAWKASRVNPIQAIFYFE